ncbi:LysE family transporter [Falsibacillus pallidus]|uniref:LysE family transporter n=1 Tax=Falsibacillus pallidus TaxID=493781 RepID=UPI000E0C9BE6|nr:LysE family transporter [Falsibacillus pallidus]
MAIASFILYIFVTAYTPGPNNIMAMVSANKYGFKRTIKFCLGVGTGFLIIMLLCSYFNLFLRTTVPKIEFSLSIFGSFYMVYLALKIMFSKEKKSESDVKKKFGFSTGMLLQFINPKVILYGITAVSTFILPFYHSQFSLMIFSLILALVGFSGTICWTIFGALFQKFLRKYRIQFNFVMALLLIYSALSIWVEN